ncbi:hypothetical protein [Rhodovulum visakhapatnamense]|uniref:hypothetical protein n=1 Tax=Rhodovulum visakhapatnamense TaxID=364297 RepID=UPI001066BD90|nr:hypothetical protein [Rhodovulum visakhapatnamense]
MFFTRVGRIVAWIGAVVGFLIVIQGYEVQINQTASVAANILPIDTAQKASAQAKAFISQGYVVLFCALVLGILTEISRSVARRSEDLLPEAKESQ